MCNAKNEDASAISGSKCQMQIHSTSFTNNYADQPFLSTFKVPTTLERSNISKSTVMCQISVLKTQYDVYSYTAYSIFSQLSANTVAFYLESNTSEFQHSVFHQCNGFLFSHEYLSIVSCEFSESPHFIETGHIFLQNCLIQEPLNETIGATGDENQFGTPRPVVIHTPTSPSLPTAPNTTRQILVIIIATCAVFSIVALVLFFVRPSRSARTARGSDNMELLSSDVKTAQQPSEVVFRQVDPNSHV